MSTTLSGGVQGALSLSLFAWTHAHTCVIVYLLHFTSTILSHSVW